MRRSRFSTTVLLVMLSVACGAKSPEAALAEFYEYDGMEEQLMDPLIRAGEKVVPLVIEKVKDKNMPRRRYAIGFLGNGAYRQALPVLQQILQDTTEEDYFRGDALQSIYQIDESLGVSYARKYQGESNYVGKIAKDILAGSSWLKERRTAWLSS